MISSQFISVESIISQSMSPKIVLPFTYKSSVYKLSKSPASPEIVCKTERSLPITTFPFPRIYSPHPLEPCKFNSPLSLRIVALLAPPSLVLVELLRKKLKFSPRSLPILNIDIALEPEFVFYKLILLAPLIFITCTMS